MGESGWSVSVVLKCALIALSILPLHALGFGTYLPTEFRALLDFKFNADLSFQFSLIFAISLFAANYLPSLIISFAAFLRYTFIWRRYQKKGYKRAKRIFFRPAEMDGGIMHQLRKPIEFTRFDATVENFVKRKIQETTLIKRYDEARPVLTLFFALVLLSYFYVGLSRAMLALGILFFIMLLTITYDEFRDSYFWIKSDRKSLPSDERKLFSVSDFDPRSLTSTLAVIAMFSFALGWLRADYLAKNPKYTVNCCNRHSGANLIAPTKDGIVFREVDGGNFFYLQPKEIIEFDE